MHVEQYSIHVEQYYIDLHVEIATVYGLCQTIHILGRFTF